MKTLIAACLLGAGLFVAPHAEAAGCLSGAAVGGVAGHMAGHHGVLGAVGGCAVGHHMAVTHNRQVRQQQQQPQRFDEGGSH